MQVIRTLFNGENLKIAFLISILTVSSTILGLVLLLFPKLFITKAKREQKKNVKKVKYLGSALVSPFLLLLALIKNMINNGEPPIR